MNANGYEKYNENYGSSREGERANDAILYSSPRRSNSKCEPTSTHFILAILIKEQKDTWISTFYTRLFSNSFVHR